MDYEVLVDELRHILNILQQEQGHIALFMLKVIDADTSDWNLIVSTLEYDRVSTKQAITHLASLLNTHLSPDIIKKIVRITILKTADPFVVEINHAWKVINTVQYIQSLSVAGISIERAIILKSHHISVAKRRRVPPKNAMNMLEQA